MRRTEQTFLRRCGWNLLLFYAIALSVGLTLGVIGAVGEDRFNQGVDATVIYENSLDENGEPVVEVQGTDPDPRFLLAYPGLALFFGTLVILPVVAVGLVVVELASRLGLSPNILRFVGAGLVALLLALAAGNSGAGVILLPMIGLLVFALTARLPRARSAQAV
jgi:hypothetical protein